MSIGPGTFGSEVRLCSAVEDPVTELVDWMCCKTLGQAMASCGRRNFSYTIKYVYT